MEHGCLSAVFLLALAVGPAASAPSGGFAVGTLVRTPPAREERAPVALSGVAERLGITFFDFRPEGEFRRSGYDLDLNLMTLPLLLDWHPFRDSFHISTGIVLNATHISLGAPAGALAAPGSMAASGVELDTVQGQMRFNPLAPYLGFGWAQTFGKDKHWGFRTDFGAAFLGAPKVSLRATGPLASDPLFQRRLAAERDDIEDDLSDFRLYPIISVSFFYRF